LTHVSKGMKTVILIRHAKSNWKKPYRNDFQRGLNKRGKKESRALGEWIEDGCLWPDLTYCSKARRAEETYMNISETFSKDMKVEYRHDLYHTDPSKILDIIQNAPEEHSRLALIGHDTWMSELARSLCSKSTRDVLENIKGFPTSAFAEYQFDTKKWKKVKNGRGSCVLSITGKSLLKKSKRNCDGWRVRLN